MPVDYTYKSRGPAFGQDANTLGERGGVVQSNKFTQRIGVNVADGIALLNGDNTVNSYTILTAATTFNIVYNNALDGADTSGALVLSIEYIDDALDSKTAIHIIGSTGSDTTAFSGFGINNVAVVSSGGNRRNGGDIQINASSNGSRQSFINAGISLSNFGVIHVGANQKVVAKYFVLYGFKEQGGSSPVIRSQFTFFNRFANTYYIAGDTYIDTSLTNHYQQADPGGALLGPGTIVEVLTQTNSNGATAAAGITYLTYENP